MPLGGCVLSGTTVRAEPPWPGRVLPAGPHLALASACRLARLRRPRGPLLPRHWPRPSFPASKCGPSYRGLEKHWQAAPPRARRVGRPFLRLRACCLGGAGASGGEAGRRAGRAGGCLPVSGAGAGSCVSGPPPSPPATARRASPASCRRRRRPLPRGLAGRRLHRRGFAPFSRPLRLPGAHLGAIHFLPESSRAC